MKARSATAHFTPELFTFLRALKRNNDREWFGRNKPRYLEHVRDPMLRFIEDFGPRLGRISRNFLADPSPVGGSMFRIHRDTRFSKDKSPYKPYAAAQFRHVRGKDVHAPGFYLHFGVDGVFIGTGLWHPDTAGATTIREAIRDDAATWKRITRTKPFRDGVLTLSGESLKRPPRGFDADHPLIDDIKRKDFITLTELDERTACSADFLDRFTAVCRASGPFVRFLTEAVGLPW